MKEAELWERVGKVIGKIDARGKDLAFGEWLEKSAFDSESKEMALAFVEGFDAADERVIGVHGLLRRSIRRNTAKERSRRGCAKGMALWLSICARRL